MIALPPAWRWLLREASPRMLVEAVALFGTLEVSGDGSNPEIIAWADEIGGWVGDWYNDDAVPWCGLFIGIVAKRAGKAVRQDMLGARNWLKWGNPVAGEPVLGDVLVFSRKGGGPRGGHVGLYVGEDSEAYHVLGGNQGNAVSIIRVEKDRLLGARNSYSIGQPANCRRVWCEPDGALSVNEA